MYELITVIGGTNQGKSYLVKQMIQNPKLNVLVYDVQDSYGDKSAKPNDLILNIPLDRSGRSKRARTFCPVDEFLDIAVRRQHTTIVIEEATIFFEGKTFQRMRQLIIDKWHAKNNIIIMFHSINSVPPRILELSDKVILFKTGDDEGTVKSKYRKLLPHLLTLRDTPDRSRLIIDNFSGEIIQGKNTKKTPKIEENKSDEQHIRKN